MQEQKFKNSPSKIFEFTTAVFTGWTLGEVLDKCERAPPLKVFRYSLFAGILFSSAHIYSDIKYINAYRIQQNQRRLRGD